MSQPGSPAPTDFPDDIRKRNIADLCYVTLGSRVYNLTPFLQDHPGGGQVILEYRGKDVRSIMNDDASHFHSEAAYEILEECFIGHVLDGEIIHEATDNDGPSSIVPIPDSISPKNSSQGAAGTSGQPVSVTTAASFARDFNVEINPAQSQKQPKFLDLNRPLLMQVFNGGFSKKFYLEQVHRPRHREGGASAPLFGNFLEPLSLTPWWVVPTVWLPPMIFGTILASKHLGLATVGYWTLGIFIWTLIEYSMHRFLFHIDNIMPDNRFAITLHFVFHGIHHYLPMDRYRLVLPPALFFVLAIPFWKLAHTIFSHNWYVAVSAFCGAVSGYIIYDLTHYFLHHGDLPSYYRQLKEYHLQHHFADHQNGFGVTSRLWDRVFGTELQMPASRRLKTK